MSFRVVWTTRGTIPMGEILSTVKGGLISEYRTRNYTPREFIYRYENLSLEERAYYLYLPYERNDERGLVECR